MNPEQLRILLVEDEPTHARLARRSFAAQADDLRLEVAGTLAEARSTIERFAPHLVIADVVLPDGRGTELIADPSQGPPVVVMTSHGDERVAVDAIKRGALDYIVKSEAAFSEIPHIARRALLQWRLIAERNAAQQALTESEARFRQMAENSQQIFWLVSLDMRETLYVSPAYQAITGRTCDALYADPESWLLALHPDDREMVSRRLSQLVAAEGAGRLELECRLLRPDGELRWIRAALFLVCDARGVPFRLGGLIEDVTERRQALEKLRQREAQLAHVTRLATMGELLAGIAHEVNQPLYAISNYAWACSRSLQANDQPLPLEKVRGWCEEIQGAASRASEIIKRLRDFTRRGDQQRTVVDLNETVEISIELLSADARQHRAAVECDLRADAPKVAADPIQIQQVLVNLLRNAFESFGEHHGQKSQRVVRVETANCAQYAEVRICDSGGGLPDEPEPLFDAFVTTKPTGMGMGLAISRSIVEAHGGSIEGRNNPAGGATFVFRLPVTREALANEC